MVSSGTLKTINEQQKQVYDSSDFTFDGVAKVSINGQIKFILYWNSNPLQHKPISSDNNFGGIGISLLYGEL